MSSQPPRGDNPWDSDDDSEQSPALAQNLFLNQERHGRFILSLVAVLLSPFFIDLPISAMFRATFGPRDPGVLAVIFVVSIFLARFCFLGIWLAWGGSRLIWRIIITYISLFFTCAVYGVSNQDRHATEAYSMAMIYLSIFAAILAVPKLFGIRWVLLQKSNDHQSAQLLRRQFSLMDMFLWTFTVAFVLGVFRWLGVPNVLDEASAVWFVFVTAIGLGLPAIASLLSMWATLHRSDDVHMRVVVAVFLILLLLSPLLLIAGIGSAPGEALAAILGTIATTLFCLIAPLLWLRSLGNRLIRVR